MKMPIHDIIPDFIPKIPDSGSGGLDESLRSLYVAILGRAIKDIFNPTYRDSEIYKSQALYWVAMNDSESITSFINICSHLDIDADKIRNIINIELSRMERGLPHRIRFNNE